MKVISDKYDGSRTEGRLTDTVDLSKEKEEEDGNKGVPIIFLILLGWRQYASRRRIIIIGYGKKEGIKKNKEKK